MVEKNSNRVTYETKKFEHLLGIKSLSDQLLNNHFTLYQGYVANTNKLMEKLLGMAKTGSDLITPEFAEMKRRFSWEWNGMMLHEYYFENMSIGGSQLDKASKLFVQLTKNFNDYDTWEKAFRATGMMRGIGWIIVYYDPLGDQIFNIWVNEHDSGHLTGLKPILVMDVFEHAFMLDYGVKRADYIEAFLKSIDWEVVSKRFDAAILNK